MVHALIVSTRYELAPGDPEPDLIREISARLGRTHDLKPLVDDLIKLAGQFALQLDANVKMLCEEIHDIDPSGQTLRYAVVNPRQPTLARPEPIFVDVPLFVRHAGDACGALDGMLAQIHEMQDWQLDLGPAHSHQTPTQP